MRGSSKKEGRGGDEGWMTNVYTTGRGCEGTYRFGDLGKNHVRSTQRREWGRQKKRALKERETRKVANQESGTRRKVQSSRNFWRCKRCCFSGTTENGDEEKKLGLAARERNRMAARCVGESFTSRKLIHGADKRGWTSSTNRVHSKEDAWERERKENLSARGKRGGKDGKSPFLLKGFLALLVGGTSMERRKSPWGKKGRRSAGIKVDLQGMNACDRIYLPADKKT